MRSRTQNLPQKLEIKTQKRPGKWRHVRDKRNNTYAPRNAPIETLDVRNREIVFGRVENVGQVTYQRVNPCNSLGTIERKEGGFEGAATTDIYDQQR